MGDHRAQDPADPAPSELDSWVLRAQRGEARAFERLVREIYPRVFRWALVRTRSPDDADEVAQRVLIRLHASLSTFSGGASFLPWLYRVTHNAAIDLFRSRGPGERLRDEIRLDAPAEGGEIHGLLEGIENQRLVELVRALFDELPDRQRQAFDLVDLQGMTPAEAAMALEVNDSTLRVHLMRARRAIRARILERAPALAKERER